MLFDRRDFLRAGAALAVGGIAAPLVRSAAAQASPRRLVIVLASGGWDTTYVLDPKPGSVEIDAAQGVLQTFGNLSVLTDAARPSVTTFFERFASLAVIVNGLQVRSFVHSDCMKRILTGTPSDQKADFGAIAAFAHAADLPVPYLVLGNSALSGPLASITARAGTTNQLSSLLVPTAYDPFVPSSGYSPDDEERRLVESYVTASTERLRATRGRTAANARELDAFVKSLERRNLLRQFARQQGGFGGREYTPDLDVQVDVALQALEGGLCHSVLLENGDWDTHNDNARQSAKHESLFAGLIALTEGLSAKNLLDDTVVVVLSEMGRTPKLNESLGKDHWPVTSALVYGAGIAGNRVLGETDTLLAARSIDLSSGSASEQGKQLQTGNFVAGILEVAGVDAGEHLLGIEPFRALGG